MHLCIYGCVAFSCNAGVDCSAPKFPNSQAQCDELPSEEITVSMPSLLPVVASAATQLRSQSLPPSPKHFNALFTMVASEYVCSILSIGKNMRAQKKGHEWQLKGQLDLHKASRVHHASSWFCQAIRGFWTKPQPKRFDVLIAILKCHVIEASTRWYYEAKKGGDGPVKKTRSVQYNVRLQA